MPGAQLSVQKIKYGEPYATTSGQQGIASEDAVVVNVTDDAGSTTHIFLPVSQALQLGRLVTKEAATLIHDAVGDGGKPLYSLKERMQLIYGYKRSDPAAIALDNLPDISTPAELFKEPGLIEDANASRQQKEWDKPSFRAPASTRPEITEEMRDPERVPFDASSDTDGDVPVVPDPFHKAKKTKLRHNHVTREMRTDGSSPSCADYFERHGIPEEEQ